MFPYLCGHIRILNNVYCGNGIDGSADFYKYIPKVVMNAFLRLL